MSEMLALEAAPPEDNAPSAPDADLPAGPKAADAKTLADLALDVPNWTLHSDHELHAFLKRYSAGLFARTKALEDSVRDIAADADSAHVRLKNTFNQFLMLSNNQFVENRVYDEEQEDFFGVESAQVNEEKTEADKDKGTAESALDAATEVKDGGAKAAAESIVNKYRAALDMGLEAMKLFVMMGEEDDTSDSSSQFDTVLDIYNERPLPFIIGTREFLEDETLGLGAAPEEFSDSDSESSYSSSYSSSDSASDSSSERGKRRSSRSRYRSSSEESSGSSAAAPPPRRRADSNESDTSGLFGRPPAADHPRRRADSDESDTSGLFGRPSVPETAVPLTKASSLRSSRRRPVFDKDEESDDSDWTSDSDAESKVTAKRKQSSASRLEHETPPPFAAPTPARKDQFFDSSDEESESGLFGSAPTTKPRTFATDDEPKQHPSLFIENSSTSNDLFGESTSTPKRRNSSRRFTPRSGSSGSSSSEEGEIFGSAKKTTIATAQAPPQGFRLPPMGETTPRESKALESKKSLHSSNSDSDAESTISGLFGRPSGSTKDKKKAPADVSVLPPPQYSRRLDLSDDSSDDSGDGGLFGAAPAKAATPTTTPAVVPPTAITPARRPMYSDSSDDDEDDEDHDGDLFGSKSQSTPSATAAPLVSLPRPHPVQRAPQSGLFGEDDSDDSDDSDGGGLFGASKPSSAVTPPPVAAKPPPVVVSRPSPVVTRDVSDSDSDDGDGGLFGISQPHKPVTVAPVAAPPAQARPRVPSNSSDSDDGGLFGAPSVRSVPDPTPVPIAAPTPAMATSVPPTRPLINRQISSDDDSDDWSDDDGGLFGAATSNPAPAKAITTPALAPPVASTPIPALSQTPAPSGSLFGPPTGTIAPVLHPPIPSAAAQMRAADSDSDSSDSDWDDDGGLFGPAKK